MDQSPAAVDLHARLDTPSPFVRLSKLETSTMLTTTSLYYVLSFQTLQSPFRFKSDLIPACIRLVSDSRLHGR